MFRPQHIYRILLQGADLSVSIGTLYVIGGKPHSMENMLYRRDHLAAKLLRSGHFKDVRYIYFKNGPLRAIGGIEIERRQNGIDYIVINDHRFVLSNYLSFLPALRFRFGSRKIQTGDYALFTLPRFVSFGKLFAKSNTFYDRSDNWQGQYSVETLAGRLKRALVALRENRLYAASSAITTSSIVMKNQLAASLGAKKKVHYLPHGYSPTLDEPLEQFDKQSSHGCIHISLVASMTAQDKIKIDYEMILQILKTANRIQLHICGPVDPDPSAKIADILDHPRVTYHGVLSPEEVVSFIARFDVGLVPYRLNEFTQGVLPLKLLDYVNADRPVCVTELPSVRQDPSFASWCHFLSDPATLETELDAYLADENAAANLAKARAELTWTNVVDRLCTDVFKFQ